MWDFLGTIIAFASGNLWAGLESGKIQGTRVGLVLVSGRCDYQHSSHRLQRAGQGIVWPDHVPVTGLVLCARMHCRNVGMDQ